MLRLLQETAAGARAHFQPYIAALPPSFDALPLFWSKEERAELEGAAGLLFLGLHRLVRTGQLALQHHDFARGDFANVVATQRL